MSSTVLDPTRRILRAPGVRAAAVAAAALALSACAAGRYAPPAEPVAGPEPVVIAASLERVRADLLGAAAQRELPVLRDDGGSGVVTLGFGDAPLENRVDCGALRLDGLDGFSGPYARYLAERLDATLDGGIDVTLEEQGDRAVLVEIAARYAVRVPPSPSAPEGLTWAFETGGARAREVPTRIPGTADTRTCAPTGAAERAILDALR